MRLSITRRNILEKLALGTLVGLAVLTSPIFLYRLTKVSLKNWQRNKYQLTRYVGRLKKSRLVEFVSKDGKKYVRITEAGRQELIHYKFREIIIKRPKKWDGQWRIIAFDIPERLRKARGALHYKLKNLGFYQLQNSVFVYPFECRKEIELVSAFFNVNRYVQYILASDLDAVQFLKKHFRL